LVDTGRVLNMKPKAPLEKSCILLYSGAVYIRNPIVYIPGTPSKFLTPPPEAKDSKFNLKYLNGKYLILVTGGKEINAATGYIFDLHAGILLPHTIPVDGSLCFVKNSDRCWVRSSATQCTLFDLKTGKQIDKPANLNTETLIFATEHSLIYSTQSDIYQARLNSSGLAESGKLVSGAEGMKFFDMDDRFYFNDWRFFYKKVDGVEKLYYYDFESQNKGRHDFKPHFLKDMKNHDIRISFSQDMKQVLIIEELSIFIYAVEARSLIQIDNHGIEADEFEKFTKRTSGFSNLNQFLCCSTDTTTFRLQLNVTLDSILFKVIKHMIASIEEEMVDSKKEEKENLLYEYLIHCPKYLHETNPIFSEVVAYLDNEKLTEKYFRFLDLSQTCQGKEFLEFCIRHSRIKSMKKYIEILESYYHENDRNFPFINQDHIIENLTNSTAPISSKYIYKYLKLHLMSDHSDITGNLKDENVDTITFKLRNDKGEIVLPNLQTKNLYANMLLEKNPQEMHQFQVYMSHCPLDIRNGSKKSRMLFHRLMQFTDEELEETYCHLIRHKWRKVKLFGMIYAWMFIAMNLMDYLSAGFYLNQLPVIVIAVVFHLYFWVLEGSAFLADRKNHFKRGINWFDAFLHPLSIVALILIYINQSSRTQTLTVEFPRWLGIIRLIFLVTISIRGMSQLTAFDGTRYFLSMLNQVFYDVFYFLFIYGYFILIYALIWQQLPSVAILGWENRESANISWLNAMKLALSGYDADPEEIYLKSVLQMVGGAILQLILQNFLIALVTSTFERVSEHRKITDLRDMLSMIYDIDCTYWTPREDIYQNEFILTLIPKEGEEKTVNERVEDLTENFDECLLGLNKKIDDVAEKQEDDIKSIHEKLDLILDLIKTDEENPKLRPEDPTGLVAPTPNITDHKVIIPDHVSRRNN
jgi:hypothetical protein